MSFEEDDGRVIAPMNVEGMPWYAPKGNIPSSDSQTPLSRREARLYRNAALKAGLLIAAVFGVCGFIFIELCILFWK